MSQRPAHRFGPAVRTRPGHGSVPADRSVAALLEAGVILLDKPPGPTSHQVTAWARDLLGLTRLGHGGTLDPAVTGVLPLLCGRARRLTQLVLGHDKEYIAVLSLSGAWSLDAVDAWLKWYTGVIYNVPPLESAVRVQVRTRRIHEIERVAADDRHIVLRIRCEAGTYIRALATDLGLLLGVPCEMAELRRTRNGRFAEAHCCTLQDLADAVAVATEGDERGLQRLILPVEVLTARLPVATVRDAAAAHLTRGAPLWRPGLVELPAGLRVGQAIAAQALDGSLIATLELTLDTDTAAARDRGEVGRPTAVLANPDAWPLDRPQDSGVT